MAYRVKTRQSPYMDVFHGHRVVRVTIDSGATGNMIRHSTAKRLGCPIISSAQSVQQAVGSSQLQVVGEIHATFTRDNADFTFQGLVVEDLDVEVLTGTPFMEANYIAVRPAKERCSLGIALSIHMGPSPHPVHSQPFVELLYSVLLLPPKLFGPEDSWKNAYQTTLPRIQSMHSSLALMHPARASSSHPSCRLSLVSFQVLLGPYVYLICQPSLVH